jgi:hypothetical protein
MNFYLTFSFAVAIVLAILLVFQNFKQSVQSDQLIHVLTHLIRTIVNNLHSFILHARLTMSPLFQRQHSRTAQFREWAERELKDHPALHSWIKDLPEQPLDALTNSTANYCTSLNIDLDWLFGSELDLAPGVRQSLKTIICEYLSGCFNAVNHKQAIMLFSVFHQLISPKQLRRRIDLRRSVFKKITSLGLTEPIPAHELIMSSESQRQELAASSLRAAASKDWEAFSQALSNVLSENG